MAGKRPAHVPGFFATCWLYRGKIVFSWDFLAAMLAALAAWFIPSDAQVGELSGPLAGAAVAVGSALVGVVVAGLAVVVAFLDDEFLSVMDEATKDYGGVEGQLFPFWFVTATGVVTILLAVLLLMTHGVLPSVALRVVFAGVLSFFVWTAIGVFNLVAMLQATGVSRAIYARGRTRRR